MKAFAAILVVAFISCQAEADFKLNGENFKDFSVKEWNNVFVERVSSSVVKQLEKIRKMIKNGNETLGVPILDPYEVDHIESTFDTFDGLIKGFGKLNNFSFTGLSEYEIEKAEFSAFTKKLSVTLKWPRMQETTRYIINGLITYHEKSYDIFGAGELNQNIEDLRLETVAYFGLRGFKAYIKKLETKIYLGNYKFQITELFYDEGISTTVSVFVTELVKQIVEENQQDLIEAIHGWIIPIADDYLSKLSLKDLLALLS